MSNLSDVIHIGEPAEFFAPVSSDFIDGLIAQYQAMLSRINDLGELMAGEAGGAMPYFLDGNQDSHARYAPSVSRLFDVKGAVAALNAAYWSKTLALTDVFDTMPQKRRDEWNKSIREMTTPEFSEDSVRPTLAGLLNMRAQFLGERVDGIFRALSGEHVTNSPAAFGKRMIVGYVMSDGGYENHSQCGVINDLRCVIAKFMGRDEPGYNSSSGLIRSLKARWGEWTSVDGGSMKIRLYKKGTAHIEVHPDMAWRLNATLAAIYPMAIPPEFRQKPPKKIKEIEMIQRPLPFSVIEQLASLRSASRRCEPAWPERYESIKNAVQFGFDADGKAARKEAAAVLESVGGVCISAGCYQFDYAPSEVINEIVASGCVPDRVSHQFFPTPEIVAAAAIELADIGESNTCLEPSAGLGGLSDLMPVDRTTCIEISPLHCKVLEAKGYSTTCADFLQWSDRKFDRIVMNPPFDQGRWQSHLSHAATLLNKGGKLVAVLPASANGKDVLPGLNLRWSRIFDNEFSGTSVSVVILVASRI